jgi:serine/threonine protein phosphatase PrpC
MKNSVVKNLKIFNGFLESILPSNVEENKRQAFDIVKGDTRHMYVVSDKDELLEGLSKVGSDLNNNRTDGFVVMTHPEDDRYKMMLIVDGNGHVADNANKKINNTSDYIVSNFKKWFSSLNQGTLDLFSSIEFGKTLKVYLRKMDGKLKSLEGEHGAKMIMALIGPEQTLIANIGDLRCYLSKGYDFGQYNEEDSKLWSRYRAGYFWNKDEFRFNVDRDKGVLQFGKDKDGFVSTYVIDNDLYDSIYLFSRGVVEGLSEDRLLTINSDIPTERVVRTIVSDSSDGSKEYISYFDGDTCEIEPIVRGAKDTTACIYAKRLIK